ncbi:unnamed protein product, partial [Discosporangium mesarthrocarpum]
GDGDGGGCRGDDVAPRLAARVWLEWGLAQHYFQDPSKGKQSFERAKEVSGLTVTLTGAMGKRTKHQSEDKAQLILLAHSAPTRPFPPPPPLGGEEAVPEEGITAKKKDMLLGHEG